MRTFLLGQFDPEAAGRLIVHAYGTGLWLLVRIISTFLTIVIVITLVRYVFWRRRTAQVQHGLAQAKLDATGQPLPPMARCKTWHGRLARGRTA